MTRFARKTIAEKAHESLNLKTRSSSLEADTAQLVELVQCRLMKNADELH